MDFNDAPAEAEYRAAARAWLEANIGEYRDLPEDSRGSEAFVAHAKAWQARPKPVVGESQPKDIPDRAQMVERMELMYAMTRLTLETDSTRFVTLYLNPLEITPKLPGVSNRTHTLTRPP